MRNLVVHIIHADYQFNYVEGQRKTFPTMDLNYQNIHSEKVKSAATISVLLLTSFMFQWEIIG
jgi:predicted small integral membrane protein